MPLTEEEQKERNRTRVRAYRKDNKDKIKSRMDVYREKNKDRLNKQMKDYRELNRAGIRIKDRRRYRRNKRDISLRMKTYWEKSTESLSDMYIKKLISSRSSILSPEDIPQSLINAKRAYIKGLRLIKEQENE
jgi:hypothetical protein